MTDSPASYGTIDSYVRAVIPDLKGVRNPESSPGIRRLQLQFSNELRTATVPFKDLSSGEKCLFIGALVPASLEVQGSAFCFWDAPDSHIYISLSEVGHFTASLRAAFESGGQLIATSHTPEAIQQFSSATTMVLFRKGHLEPTQIRPVSELDAHGDLITSLILDDLPV